MKDISIALSSIFSGISDFSKYKLGRFYLLSGIIGLGVMILMIFASYTLGDDIGNNLIKRIPYIGNKSEGVNEWIGRIVSIILGFVIFKYILLIALGPLMTTLSEKIEKIEGVQHKSSFTLAGFTSGMIRGLRLNLRNFLFEMFLTIPLIILSFVPGLAILTTPLLFLVQAYYVGFGILDYYLERQMSVKESVTFVKNHRLFTLIIGSIFTAFLLIPILGLIIAPTFCTTAGSVGLLKIQDRI